MSERKLTRNEFARQVEKSEQWLRFHRVKGGYDLNNTGSSIRFEKSLIIKFKSRT